MSEAKMFLIGKYDQFLQFLGLRVSNEWLLLRAIHREYGEKEAKNLYAMGIILGLKHGTKNNNRTVEKIIKATETKQGKRGEEGNRMKVISNRTLAY